MANRLSIVVHTESGSPLLGRCLAALVSQKLPTRDLEIIVAGARKSMATRQLVVWWNALLCGRGSSTRLLYVVLPHTASRDAVRLCSGEIVGFIDENETPPPDWASHGVAMLLEREATGGPSALDGRELFQRKRPLLAYHELGRSSRADSPAQRRAASTRELCLDGSAGELEEEPRSSLPLWATLFLFAASVVAALASHVMLALALAPIALGSVAALLVSRGIDASILRRAFVEPLRRFRPAEPSFRKEMHGREESAAARS